MVERFHGKEEVAGSNPTVGSKIITIRLKDYATKKKDTTRKSLYLSDDKKLLGVAGGIAEYFDIDPALYELLPSY